MVDIFPPDKRSRIMAAVKGKNTKIEMKARRELHSKGLRYRLHCNDLPGKPDLVFPRYRLALFVHGCFWHGHEGCKKAELPTSNVIFWQNKITKTKARDLKSYRLLQEAGWQCIIVWECQMEKALIDWDLLARRIRGLTV